ncbi:hypothetical protein UFOVP215_35 [uncultured Caudovirales phage]|uniref:Uncharacterized protein n=1 Tax=uncultured Caudovirales phage TaxID=2100421 RepID=A0A6J7WPP9_9CAUD|nr:hypothetical protein UFOVP215_35 [uncultured Caudovirales phage]
MPKSFAKAQADALNKLGGQDREQFVPFVAQSILEQYGVDFKILLEKYINSRQVVSSGKLADNIYPSVTEDGNKLIVTMLDYFDFPNEGVKGVRNSKNGVGSPYKFKNYGMNAQGRASIKEYILSGKSKVKNIKAPVGLEKKFDKGKKKSLIDKQVDNLIYMIKRYGIKRTEYFNDAFEEAFKDLDIVMGEALGIDIAMNIQTISTKKIK